MIRIVCLPTRSLFTGQDQLKCKASPAGLATDDAGLASARIGHEVANLDPVLVSGAVR